MLDIRFVRNNPEIVKENIRKKFQDEKLPLVDEVIALDEKLRSAKTRGDELRKAGRDLLNNNPEAAKRLEVFGENMEHGKRRVRILKHYEENRQFELTGKAMIVAFSRPIAIRIYKKILDLRPDWTEKVKVVMTGSNNDPEEWHSIVFRCSYSFSPCFNG